MPSSPKTPRHSRNSSNADAHSQSPSARRHSKASINETTPSFRNSLTHQDTLDISVIGSGGVRPSNGMGNLADELADAFSDSGDEDESGLGHSQQPARSQRDGQEVTRDGGATGDTAIDNDDHKDDILGIPYAKARGHARKASEYDGSEYGSESDLDAGSMTASLLSRIDAVESLARRGIENNGGPADEIFKRVTEGLRDLGSQSSVEGNASRLITAHSALTTHLAHQTRQLHSLTFPLLSPLAAPPDADTIDELIPLLVSLSEGMPKPSTVAFNSLSALHSMTAELIQTLSYLSDTLHMSRQTTATATRRLKSAKELVAEMRREEEMREEGELWLDKGNWGERLKKRECAGICGDVVGGFEDVCNGWRERLLAQEESKA